MKFEFLRVLKGERMPGQKKKKNSKTEREHHLLVKIKAIQCCWYKISTAGQQCGSWK